MQHLESRGGNEIRALTGIRGAAAVWVLVFHITGARQPGDMTHAFVDHGYLAVDLFLILSGYVMALNYGERFHQAVRLADFAGFLRKRFARTYPLYFLASLVMLFLYYACGININAWPANVCGAPAIIPNLLLIQSWHTPFCSLDAPGWSISAEWGAYLLFPLLCQVALFGPKYRVVAATIVAALVLIVLSALPTVWLGQGDRPGGPLAISNGQTLAPGLRCLAGFVIGLAAYRLSASRIGLALKTGTAPGLILTAVLAALLCLPGTDVLVVLLFAPFVVSLSGDQGRVARIAGSEFIYFLGEISYSIYLIHYPIFLLIMQALWPFHHGYGGYAIDIATVACTLTVATLTYRFIERPGRQMLNGLWPVPAVRVRPT